MKKIKKIFIGIGVFIVVSLSKLGGLISSAKHGLALYGIPQPDKPTTGEILIKIAKPALIVVLFIMGLVVVINNNKNKGKKVIQEELTDKNEKNTKKDIIAIMVMLMLIVILIVVGLNVISLYIS